MGAHPFFPSVGCSSLPRCFFLHVCSSLRQVFFVWSKVFFFLPCGSCSLFAPVVLERIVAVRGSNLKQAEEGCWKQRRQNLSKEMWCNCSCSQKTQLYLSFYSGMKHASWEQKNPQVGERKHTILEGSTPTCKRKDPCCWNRQALLERKHAQGKTVQYFSRKTNAPGNEKCQSNNRKLGAALSDSEEIEPERTGVLSGASGKMEDLQPRFVRGGGRRKWVLRLHEGDLREGDARASVMAS